MSAERLSLTLAAALLVAVASVAGAVLIVAGDRGANDVVHASGLRLTASETRGRELFATTCGRCHTLRAAAAVGRTGPNLDTIAPWGLTADFVATTIHDGMVRGNGTMPEGLFHGPDARDVAAFVSAVTRDAAAAGSTAR